MSYKEEIKDYIKTETKQEAKKLKDMSWSDRFWYIWEYYKWHMLGLFLAGCLISVIATSIYNSTLTTQFYCVVINNPMVMRENMDPITVGFKDYMQFGKKDQIFAESLTLPTDGSFDDLALASQGKLAAIIASGDLDVMISDQVIFQRYAEMDSYLDLETVLPPDLLEIVRDRLLYVKNESGQSLAYGIDVSGSWLMQSTGIVTEPACFAIMLNTGNLDNCIAMLRFMFESQ